MIAALGAADAVLFDLDGVLVDSRRAFATSLNAALAAHGLPERPDEELHRYLGPPLHRTMRRLVGEDEVLVESCVAAYRARVRVTGPEESRLFDGLPCVAVLWGIGDETELRAAGAATLVTRPAELPRLLAA